MEVYVLKKYRMNFYCLIYNIGLFLLIGLSVWYLKSAWPFLGLIAVKALKA
jgi:hypothetical protein